MEVTSTTANEAHYNSVIHKNVPFEFGRIFHMVPSVFVVLDGNLVFVSSHFWKTKEIKVVSQVDK